jgi:quinol monooxygenase YgiN
MRVLLQVLIAAALLPLASMTPAGAQEDPTVSITSYVDVAPASKGAAATILKELAEASRKDAGAMRFEVLQRTTPAHQFVILAIFKDQQALDAHTAAAHTKQSVDKLQPLLIAPIDTRQCTILATATASAPAAGALYGVTHVDVIPPKRDDGAAALQGLADPTRKSAGNMRYEAYREKGRLNHFTVVEVWKDEAAIDAQETAPHMKAFRASLGAMTGALFDRRWYKSL